MRLFIYKKGVYKPWESLLLPYNRTDEDGDIWFKFYKPSISFVADMWELESFLIEVETVRI